MRNVGISLSILDWEPNLEKNITKIKDLVDNGLEWLHIDVMRPPFVENYRFDEESYQILGNEFKGSVNFDFHLMVDEPLDVLKSIKSSFNTPDVYITIHREALRDVGNLHSNFKHKDYDLSNYDTHDDHKNEQLRDVDKKSIQKIYHYFDFIKNSGFKCGIALEPYTSLNSIYETIADKCDLVLLMSVKSGEGGQSYIENTTKKISDLRNMYSQILIEVDGGIKVDNIVKPFDAGANLFVVGSEITRNDSHIKAYQNLEKKLN